MASGAAAKKLIGAARRWQGGRPAPDEAEADAALLGIELPQESPRCEFEEGELYAVLAENWPAVRAFAAASTQWRYAEGRPAGLDYAAAQAAAAALGIVWGEAFDGLQAMEAEALKGFGEEYDRAINQRIH